ncbi:alpha-latrocrustotoxin-Lt1a-like [Parasteatoda tepidariorum]|uniref:alpha-latrocrustotoxin-Lt1a-like n=1 Tax=Parasteatoda tepidariorum TaxID=114398 RepID=UPI001C71A63A|nr:alpha-latrocrustotoxin-Lt1a-like [Parasteatoda tepidariorum]
MALDGNYAHKSTALMRLKRELSLEELSAYCKRLEDGQNVSDTWLGIAGAVASVAGALVMPGLGVVLGGIMLGASAAKGLLGDTSIERDCADVPFKELEQRLDKKFNEVNRKLDQQAEILKGISEKVSETLSQLELTRQEMNAGFERILTSITAQDISDIISDIENARMSIAFSESSKREASKEEYVNIIKQELKDNFLFNYVKQQGSLFEALFSMINKKYAVPSNINDQNAYNALAALNFGTLTYASIVFTLLDEYAYISEYFYQTNELGEFNQHLDKLLFYFTTFKRIMNTNRNGLIDKVIQLLDSAKNSHDMRNSKKDLYSAFESHILTLRQLKQKINDITLPVIDKAPENDIDISFKSYVGVRRSNTNFLDWKRGAKVSYALQFESDGKYSKISKWLPQQEVIDIANPDIKLRNSNRMNRLVFRKFDNNPPELIRVVSNAQRAFRDVDRDLYNLAFVDSYQDYEILNNMNKLISLGASVKAVFENKRGVIHAAAESGRVGMLKRILDIDRSLINQKDSIGYTPLHIASERKEVDVVKELIKRRADVNCKSNTYHLTPLHLAVRYQSEDTVKELLASPNINPNEQDKAGMTPLHISVSDETFSSSIVWRLLTNRKVDPNVKDANGLAPIHYSAILGLYMATQNFQQRKNVDMFPKDNTGMTPLHYAAMKGHDGLITDLVTNNRSHINDVAGEREWSPLHYAVFFKQAEFAKLLPSLVNNQPYMDVDCVDVDNQTPLHLAAASGQKDVVSTFIARGAKVYIKTVNDHTPLDLAIIHGKKDIIGEILKAEERQKTQTGKAARQEDTLACGLAKGDILDMLIRANRCSSKFLRATDHQEDSHIRSSLIESIRSKLNVTSDNMNRYARKIVSRNENLRGKKYLSSSKSKENLDRKSSAVLKHVDINGALLLLDLFIRKFTNEKYNSDWVNDDEQLDARARTLSIMESLEKVMESVAKEGDLFDVHSKIYKAVLSGNENKLLSTLCSYVKDNSSLEPKNVDKIVTHILKNSFIISNPKKSSGKFQNVVTYTCY